MMGIIIKSVAVTSVVAFTVLTVNFLVNTESKLELKKMEVKSLNASLKELNIKYDKLNEQLDEVETEKQSTVDELLEQKQRLEAEKIKLEGELQAKKESKLDEATANLANTVTNTQTVSASSGGKHDWMRASGIPEHEWQYVDYIVSKESGWNPCAYNPMQSDCSKSSAEIKNQACGLAQSLPCGKQESYGHWSDPVANLRWQYEYVTQRYGGYKQAYSFWLANKWY